MFASNIQDRDNFYEQLASAFGEYTSKISPYIYALCLSNTQSRRSRAGKTFINFQFPHAVEVRTRVGDILEAEVNKKYTISDTLWEGHKRRKEKNKKNGKGFGYSLFTADSPYTNTLSARYYKDGSEILIHQNGINPRKLTPREAARLQGFPDSYVIPVSDAQAYRQFGNSVAVPVIKAIAFQMKLCLKG